MVEEGQSLMPAGFSSSKNWVDLMILFGGGHAPGAQSVLRHDCCQASCVCGRVCERVCTCV